MTPDSAIGGVQWVAYDDFITPVVSATTNPWCGNFLVRNSVANSEQSLAAGKQATATATVTAGFVSSITLSSGGSGYSSEPTVTVTGGGGTGAEAKAILSGDKVASVIVLNAGSGYNTPPAILITGPAIQLSLSIELVPKISVRGGNGTTQRVEWSATLGVGAAWQVLTNLTLASDSVEMIDLAVGSSTRYYRLAQSPGSPNSGGDSSEPQGIRPQGFVWIPPGTFKMGSSKDPNSQMNVTLTRGFFMCSHEVTQGEFSNNNYFTGDPDLPVEQVFWSDAVRYCETKTNSEQLTGWLQKGWVYRLPTEAEWEYAARSGTTTVTYFGNDPGFSNLSSYAWYYSNSGASSWDYPGGAPSPYQSADVWVATKLGGKTHPVAWKYPNAWGLYDMYGNVWEWCQDWFGPYPGGNATDPRGPASGSSRVIRGGSWMSSALECSSEYRYDQANPWAKYPNVGFRVVLAQQP